jgi:hypothetical protein
MDQVQSRDMVSSTPANGKDCADGNVSDITKSMENYLSTLHPNIGFVKAAASGDGTSSISLLNRELSKPTWSSCYSKPTSHASACSCY